jgi:hypothetical protein
MSSVVISGNTSGAITLAAPDVSGTNTLTLPAVTGTILTNKSAGTILQVVQAVDTTTRNTSSNYPTDSGWSASITPTSATSKILVLVNWQTWVTVGSGTNVNKIGEYGIWRSGSQLIHTRLSLSPPSGSWVDLFVPVCLQYLDSPATTSSVTYTMRWGRFSGYDNNLYMNDGTPVGGQMISTIMMIEVAA